MNGQLVQNIGSAPAEIVQAGLNMQSDIYGYLDENYLYGVSEWPVPENNDPNAGSVIAGYRDLLRSWPTNGYNQGVPVQLFPFQDTVIRPIDLSCDMGGVKRMQPSNNASMKFGWQCKGAYWRSTREFSQALGTNSSRTEQSLLATTRWDENKGYVSLQADLLDFKSPTSSVGESEFFINADTPYTNSSKPYYMPAGDYQREFTSQPVGGGTSDDNTRVSCLPTSCLYMDPEPIPKLMLSSQPTVGSLASGANISAVQICFNLKAHLRFKGRPPARLYTTWLPSLEDKLYGTRQWQANNLPIFRPFKVRHYNIPPVSSGKKQDAETTAYKSGKRKAETLPEDERPKKRVGFHEPVAKDSTTAAVERVTEIFTRKVGRSPTDDELAGIKRDIERNHKTMDVTSESKK